MQTEQMCLPFRAKHRNREEQSNCDLIGRTYLDNLVTVTVVALCADDDSRVLVNRRPGKTARMPAWIMRAIFAEEDRARKVAA
ncbi:MAG TPA: hypothetical protein VE969_03980 [Pyrinomonadaceae bacterium]|nr:hypothetical protein [Pyrinomonadaceae bacterium]